jgi:uncharacterized UPF0160 family protein
VDAFDNGTDLVKNLSDITPYYIQHVFSSIEPTWRENRNKDEAFLECVEIAKKILKREIIHANDILFGKQKIIEEYQKTKDKRIIVFEDNYPFEYFLHEFPEPLFAIYPRKTDNTWGVKTIRDSIKTFNSRKTFPKEWAGLKDEELQRVSGVPDAVFCHRSLNFIAVAKSREGAIALARIAVES